MHHDTDDGSRPMFACGNSLNVKHKFWLLPPHERSDVKGLTEVEIKDYMRVAKDYFSQGKAIPVSDVGLISTQEDVVRQPRSRFYFP